MSTPSLPTYRAFLFPILQVLERSAGSLSKREMDASIIDQLSISDEQLAVSYPEGSSARGSKVVHRFAFARSTLKLIGAIAADFRNSPLSITEFPQVSIGVVSLV